jgi:hypothetical protein
MLAALLCLFGPRLAQAQSPVLIKEDISREYSIHLGGIQTPEIKEVVSREMSLFILNGPAEPYSQVVSREYSIAVDNPGLPPQVTGFTVSPSPTGTSVGLNWANYNQWAVRDVARFDIYLSDRPFSDVTGMAPFLSMPAESVSAVLAGLPQWRDHFIAIVAVDALGNFNPAVIYSAAYFLTKQVISREVSLFIGAEPTPPYKQVISREYSLVVTTPEPPAAITSVARSASPDSRTVTLNWSGYNEWLQRDVARYDIYYSPRPFASVVGMTPVRSVPGETFATTFTNLPAWQDHSFAVVPVDAAGNFIGGVPSFGVYVLFPQMVSRELSLFIGAEPDPPYRQVVSRGREPYALVADGSQFHTLTGLFPGDIYYVAVVAKDALGNFSPVVRAVSAQTADRMVWRNSYFTPEELANPNLEATLWGDAADPDGDGYVNALELALGGYLRMASSLNQAGSAPLLPVAAVARSGGTSFFDVRYRRKADADYLGVGYHARLSPDLTNWFAPNTPGQLWTTASTVNRPSEPGMSGFESVALRLSTPLPHLPPKLFARLGVTLGESKFTPYSGEVLRANPAACWRLDDRADATNVVEEIAGHHGTPVGGVAFAQQPHAQRGYAARFDGVNDFVNLGTARAITGQGAFTVEAWIKTTGATTTNAIVAQRDETSDNGGFRLELHHGGRVRWWSFGDELCGFDFFSTRLVNDGQWHYIVVTREADGTGRIYVDGTLDSQQAAPPRALVPLKVSIGADLREIVLENGSGRFFPGLIDEVAFYHRTLLPAEISGHFSNLRITPP